MKKLIFIFITLLLCGCGESEKELAEAKALAEKEAEKEKKSFPIVIEEVGPGEIRRVLKSQARLESRKVAHISPQVAGKIEERLMEEGLVVKEGDILVKLSTPPGAEIDMQRIELKISQSSLKLSREKNLKKKAPAAIADTVIEQTELQLKELQLDLSKRKEEQALRTIKAPFDGALDSVQGDIGQQVGTGTVLAKLHDMSELRISVDTTEARLQELRLHQKVYLTLLSDQSQAEGQVALIPSSINQDTGSGKVIVKLKNRPKHWLAGAFVIVEFQMDLIKGDIVIDKNLIAYKQNRPYVWLAVEKEGTLIAKQVWIKIGQKDEGKAIITEGLILNDKLMIDGLKGMREGMRVHISKSDAS